MNKERIIPVDYADEMKKSYIDYSMSVITSRALPDIRDGLKPVHRRILYSMKELGLVPTYDSVKNKYVLKTFRKSARIVGDTMGKYHPHGDKSIYDAMVILSQEFKMMEPLIDGEGNFGSIDGDSHAQMRYTEARLSEIIVHFLNDLDKDVVDFVDNFDGSLIQPVILPAKYPNLLVNGAEGIAVGMSTKIPSHNLAEVINGVLAYMSNPKITIDELMKHIPAPDFPTGGTIINKDELKELYVTGKGKIKIRSKYKIEKGHSGRTNIVITEVPYTYSGNVIKMVEEIANLAKNKKMPELYNIQNQSSMEGVRLLLEVKKGINIDNFLVKLYKQTGMESTFHAEMRALVDGVPKILNLKDFMEEFVSFQEETYTRKYKYLLRKSEKRLEVLDGLLIAHDVIDVIIELIRGSKSKAVVEKCLISGDTSATTFRLKRSEKTASLFNFTERQAEAILNMQLIQLIGMEMAKLQKEYKELNAKISSYNKYLSSKKSLNILIKKELNLIKARYEKKRKTKITQIEEVEYKEIDIIEQIYILVDKYSYLKIVDEASFVRINEETLKEFKYVVETKSNDKLVLMGSDGNQYTLTLSDIARCKITDRGTPLSTLTNAKEIEFIFLNTFSNIKDKKYVFVTSNGDAKIVAVSHYETNHKKMIAIKLDSDKLIYCNILSSENYIGMYTNKNSGIKFKITDIPEKNRGTKGSPTINLHEGEFVVASSLFKQKPHILKYNGKNIDLSNINVSKRNCVGKKL